MQNKILLIVVIILSFVLVYVSSREVTTFFNTEASKKIVVKDKNNLLKTLNIEDYIVGVVAAEMPASFNEEALKAQAVASRTYAIYKINTSTGDFDVVTDVSNQSYITVDEMKTKWGSDFNKYYDKVKLAVDNTKGEVMTYDGEVIEAYYFAMSNGYTEKSSLVFASDRDYLQSVESNYESDLKNFEVTKEFTKNEICTKLNISCDNINIANIERSETGRVNKITINGVTFKGTEVRKKLDLRSTDFTITNDGDKYLITTKGYGHGVGMSQYGANGMASEGYNYQDILKYYYQNIEFSTI